MKKPLIGIVLDNETSGDYSSYPYYVLRRHYFDAIEKAGGIPLGIHHSEEFVGDYLHLLDGLLMPGGDYDIPPEVYGDTAIHESVVTKKERLQFDWNLTQMFLEADKPILGICAGEQLLAVMLGGTLIQDIKSASSTSLEHYLDDRASPAHNISIEEGTLLKKILKKD
jgi:putative glutamine amidotransferase